MEDALARERERPRRGGDGINDMDTMATATNDYSHNDYCHYRHNGHNRPSARRARRRRRQGRSGLELVVLFSLLRRYTAAGQPFAAIHSRRSAFCGDHYGYNHL